MGKKLQGAKLRAKKRSIEQREELQEQQAEDVTTKFTKDAAIFTIDTIGDHVPRTEQVTVTKATTSTKKRKPEWSKKEQQQIQRLVQHHQNDSKKLQSIADHSKRILDHRKGQNSKLIRNSNHSSGTSQKNNHTNTTQYDIWNDNTPNLDQLKSKTVMVAATTVDPDHQQINTKMTPSPGIGGALAGTRPAHSTIHGRTLDAMKKLKQQTKNAPQNTNTATTTAVVVVSPGSGIAVDVAKSGQSYHPDPVAHAKLLQQVAHVESLRDAATNKLSTPLSTGMSEETKSLLLNDDDDDDDDSIDEKKQNPNDNEVADNDTMAVGPVPKRADKLTKAQRNKQRRVKQELINIKNNKFQKKMLKQVGNIHRIQKEFKILDQTLVEKKTILQKKLASKPIPGADMDFKVFQLDPITAPTVPLTLPPVPKITTTITRGGTGTSVPVTTTTTVNTTSLRTIQPRGSLLLDRIHSYTDRKIVDISKTNRKQRKASECLSMQDGINILKNSNQQELQSIQTNEKKNHKKRKSTESNNNTTVVVSASSSSSLGVIDVAAAVMNKNKEKNHRKRPKAYKGKHNQNIKGTDFHILGC